MLKIIQKKGSKIAFLKYFLHFMIIKSRQSFNFSLPFEDYKTKLQNKQAHNYKDL